VAIGGQEANYSALGGTLVVQASAGVLRVYGFLTGLHASTTGGWHIHTGYQCSNAATQGGHYCLDGTECGSDPWAGVTYTSDASGNAEIDLEIADFSLVDSMPVAGRALVIHDSDATRRRIGCGLIVPSTAQIAVISPYPSYAGGLAVKGLLGLRYVGTRLEIQGSLVGVTPSETAAGWHIHSGFSCDPEASHPEDAVGGHYYDTSPVDDTPTADPWSSVTYSSTANGAAEISQTMAGFSVDVQDLLPVFGRTLVVHSTLDGRVGCGVIGGHFQVSRAYVSTLPYPGYIGATLTNGAEGMPRMVAHLTERAGRLFLTATVTGLAKLSTGGWHIHTEHACNAEQAHGSNDHYYPGMSADPWAEAGYASWSSDDKGVAQIAWSSADFSLEGVRPVAGRTVVVHAAISKERVACGVITPTADQFATVGTHPGLAANGVHGLLRTGRTLEGINVTGVLTGLESSTSAGVHIHTGSSCAADAAFSDEATKGHYREGLASDPWTTNYVSDSSGVATVDLAMPDFSLYQTRPVYGRTIVVHSTAVRVGCAVIGEDNALYAATATLGPYPGYTGSLDVKGLFALRSAHGSAELFVHALVAGLPADDTAGWHIHAGHTCDNATRVGGHYYQGLGATDPWSAVAWESDGQGVAEVGMSMPDFSLQPGAVRDVSGRVIVVHANGLKVAWASSRRTATAIRSSSAWGWSPPQSAPPRTLRSASWWSATRTTDCTSAASLPASKPRCLPSTTCTGRTHSQATSSATHAKRRASAATSSRVPSTCGMSRGLGRATRPTPTAWP
jgi:Cu/Zn superoxide dismutase